MWRNGKKPTLALAAAFIVVLVLLALPARQSNAQNYQCGNPQSGHCYGVASWMEQPQYFGAYADILQVAMGCPSGCGGFIDDEIWLIDTQTAGCTSNGYGVCWVEAGTIFQEGDQAQFFWADARPMTSSTFNLHIIGPADAPGVVDHYMIIQDGRGGPGIYQVWIYNDSQSTLYNGTSTSNPMSGNRIDIGQELSGTQNASAGNANFTRNIWAVQVLDQQFVFWYNRQIDQGGVTSINPPFASWTIDPASPPPPEGGQFTTHCCQ